MESFFLNRLEGRRTEVVISCTDCKAIESMIVILG